MFWRKIHHGTDVSHSTDIVNEDKKHVEILEEYAKELKEEKGKRQTSQVNRSP